MAWRVDRAIAFPWINCKWRLWRACAEDEWNGTRFQTQWDVNQTVVLRLGIPIFKCYMASTRQFDDDGIHVRSQASVKSLLSLSRSFTLHRDYIALQANCYRVADAYLSSIILFSTPPRAYISVLWSHRYKEGPPLVRRNLNSVCQRMYIPFLPAITLRFQ